MRCGIDEYIDKLTKELSKRGSSPAATTLLKQINKIDKRTVDINGVKIEYYSVSDGGIQNLAVNTSEGIFLQKDITAAKALEYLNQESVDLKLQNVLEVKKQADDKLYTEYNVRLEDLLNTMDNNQIRKFLLLHEHRHNVQVAKRSTRQEFLKEYKEDPVKFEYDANKFALMQLNVILKDTKDKSKEVINKKSTEVVVKPKISNKPKINISSNSKGLAGALTNPTTLSKRKGNIQNEYPVNYNGVEYDSVESAYQANKVNESVTKPGKAESKNYKLMVTLITEKLKRFPKLVQAIDKEGGLDYLNSAIHQPTSKNTVWETNGQDWFMSALKEAYKETKNSTNLAIVGLGSSIAKNPDIEYLVDQLNWAKQEIEVPASPEYKFMIQGIIERAEEGLTKTDGLPEFVKQFKKDIMDVSAKRLEVLTEYLDSTTGMKTYQMKPKIENGVTTVTSTITDPVYDAMVTSAYAFIGEVKDSSNSPFDSYANTIEDKLTDNIKDTYHKGILYVYDDSISSNESYVTMLVREDEFVGKPLADRFKTAIESSHDNGNTFIINGVKNDKELTKYLDKIGATYKEYNETTKEESEKAESKVEELVKSFFTKELRTKLLGNLSRVYELVNKPYRKQMEDANDEDWAMYNDANNAIASAFTKVGIDFNKNSTVTSGRVLKAFEPYVGVDSNLKYEIFPGVYANDEQKVAIDKLEEFLKSDKPSMLLKGRGGVGKTSIISKVLDNMGIEPEYVHYSTPSNKATKVLKAMNQRAGNKGKQGSDSEFLTVAQVLSYELRNGVLIKKTDKNGMVVPPRSLGNRFTTRAKVIVVDEASMLPTNLYEELQKLIDKNKDIKVIYMGDNVQLPPINEGSHVAKVFREHTESNRVSLTKRMRQKEDSPILPITDVLAGAVESRVELDGTLKNVSEHTGIEFSGVVGGGVEYTSKQPALLNFIEELKNNPDSTRWIMYNNNDHAEGNRLTSLVRNRLFGKDAEKEYVVNEQLYVGGPYGEDGDLNTGDEVTVLRVVKENSDESILYTMWDPSISKFVSKRVTLPVAVLEVKDNISGEVYEVFATTKKAKAAISRMPKPDQFGVNKMLLQSSPAYVLTSHKAQGSTYKNVYADIGNIFKYPNNIKVENLQSAYVATSRASEKLVMVDVPSAFISKNDKTEAKQEVDIITPNEAFRDNVNKKIECKE